MSAQQKIYGPPHHLRTMSVMPEQNPRGWPAAVATTGAGPGFTPPDPAEFGLPPGQRKWHSDGNGGHYKVRDDGSRQYAMGGSYVPVPPPVQASSVAAAAAFTAQPGRLPDTEAASARLRAVGIENVDSVNTEGESVLMQALLRNDTATALALISLGANIDARNGMSRNAAHYAAINGNIPVMQELLKINPSLVHMRDSTGKDMFMCAVSFGRSDVMRCLKDQHGANIHARSNNGMTNLMWAAKNGQPSLKTLLEMGVNPLDVIQGDHGQVLALNYAEYKRDFYSTGDDAAQAHENVRLLRAAMGFAPENRQ